MPLYHCPSDSGGWVSTSRSLFAPQSSVWTGIQTTSSWQLDLQTSNAGETTSKTMMLQEGEVSGVFGTITMSKTHRFGGTFPMSPWRFRAVKLYCKMCDGSLAGILCPLWPLSVNLHVYRLNFQNHCQRSVIFHLNWFWFSPFESLSLLNTKKGKTFINIMGLFPRNFWQNMFIFRAHALKALRRPYWNSRHYYIEKKKITFFRG